jgi:hypothetical protein
MTDAHAHIQSHAYHRYHIVTRPTPNLIAWPSRFKVRVGKLGLAKHLISEILHTRFDMEVVTSRPCMYGVFSGPVGGFAPRENLCVGCLRCTTEFPDFVTIRSNPERQSLGDSYFTYRHVETIAYEAGTGRVPVKGAGYRGRFGGEGWDGMWTDMSEIVRPTRDGIHGREFISTVVDLGRKPGFLMFDREGQIAGAQPETLPLPLPLIFDRLHPQLESPDRYKLLAEAAAEIETLQVIPLEMILAYNLRGEHLVPLVTSGDVPRLAQLPFRARMVEMDGWDASLLAGVQAAFPQAVVCLRQPFGPDVNSLLEAAERGVGVFHLTADYHGEDPQGRFIFDLIREAHLAFVEAGRRDEVTLIGSGGVVAAEHIPKALIAGLDAVGLDLPLLVALQGRLMGEFSGREGVAFHLPARIPPEWGVQRLKNLIAAWRDQLLEILGAMGLREVRRLRGEMGRALFMVDLEREAFAEIEGYDA